MSEPIEDEQTQETLQPRNSGSYMIKKTTSSKTRKRSGGTTSNISCSQVRYPHRCTISLRLRRSSESEAIMSYYTNSFCRTSELMVAKKTVAKKEVIQEKP